MRAIIAFFALWALMLTPTVAQEADLAKPRASSTCWPMMQSAFFLPKRPAPDAKPNLLPCLMSAPICAALRVLR